ncbi:formylmethanofuran dehydrogenase subunit E family protein [bacterium]|nr:formylmethanofuran dehydrogenase subunit E family protein [bacterium]MBU1652840.1 formylmethanofuran dehydrogenase subunit E family protein [bacterium]
MEKSQQVDAELLEAKRFHGHLGPYLVVGMKAGHFIASVLGSDPFSYRIFATVGMKPPHSCVLDGLQVTTPCTIGNSMLQSKPLDGIIIWAEEGKQKLEFTLRESVQQHIDKDTNRDNEEQISQEIWESGAEELFIIRQTAL